MTGLVARALLVPQDVKILMGAGERVLFAIGAIAVHQPVVLNELLADGVGRLSNFPVGDGPVPRGGEIQR